MNDNYEKKFWESYSENHFWRLNDKQKVKENSIYYDSLYDRFLPQDVNAKILDVGCGGGHFLSYLVRKGYSNMEGVDIAPGLVKFVKEEIWQNVHNEDALEFLKHKENTYDLIAANDIIEHFNKNDIIKFLFMCNFSLKKGGKLIIKTPNMANLFAARNRYVDFTHQVGFTEYSLFEVCSAADFSQIDMLSEFSTENEPPFFKWIRRMYLWVRQSPPKVLSTNLLAVCRKS